MILNGLCHRHRAFHGRELALRPKSDILLGCNNNYLMRVTRERGVYQREIIQPPPNTRPHAASCSSSRSVRIPTLIVRHLVLILVYFFCLHNDDPFLWLNWILINYLRWNASLVAWVVIWAEVALLRRDGYLGEMSIFYCTIFGLICCRRDVEKFSNFI